MDMDLRIGDIVRLKNGFEIILTGEWGGVLNGWAVEDGHPAGSAFPLRSEVVAVVHSHDTDEAKSVWRKLAESSLTRP